MKIRQIKTAQAGAMTAGIGLALMKVVLGILAGIGLSIEGIKLALPIIKRKLAERKAEKEGKLTEDDVHDVMKDSEVEKVIEMAKERKGKLDKAAVTKSFGEAAEEIKKMMTSGGMKSVIAQSERKLVKQASTKIDEDLYDVLTNEETSVQDIEDRYAHFARMISPSVKKVATVTPFGQRLVNR